MGRIALVTGGLRGIGRGIAEFLAADGFDVAVCRRSDSTGAETFTEHCHRAGSRALCTVCDVSRPDEVTKLVATVNRDLGPIHTFVHAVGPFSRVPLQEETALGFSTMFAANLNSFFYLMQAIAPGMRDRGEGNVLAFGLANADRLTGQTEITAYSLAKAALIGLVRSYAKALGPDGIRVNAISPGYIDSGSLPHAEIAPKVSQIPLRRLGAVADCVGAARYLLSDEARYITGANLVVAGGWGA